MHPPGATQGALAPNEGRTPLDLFQLAVMLMTSVAVWRLQDLFTVLGAIKIQYIAPALALLAFMVESDPRRKINRIVNPLFKKTMGVGLMVMLSIPTSLWPGYSFRFFMNDHAKTLLLMVLMAASIRSMTDLRRYAVMHIVGALVYSYFVVTTFKLRNGRLGSLIYYDSNDLGLLLVCTIPMCVYFLQPSSKPLTRLVSSAALGMIVFTIVQTGSRGAFLAFLACGAYLLFNFSAITKKVRIYAVAALVAFLLIFGGPTYWEMMSSLLEPTQDANWSGEVGRRQIWKRGFGYMVTHPITGVGGRAFGIAEGTISQIASRQDVGIGLKWSAAHNSFVEVGAELGFIGLGLFLASLWTAWRFVRDIGAPRNAARAGPLGAFGHAIGGTLIAYCVAGFFVSAGYSAYLYTIFALVIGMMKLAGARAPVAAPAFVTNGASSAPRPPSTGRRRPNRGRRGGPVGSIHPGPARLPAGRPVVSN